MIKILYVTSEIHPLIKTGGLADVSGSLPNALAQLGADVRMLMPYYQAIHTDLPIYYKSTVRLGQFDANVLETQLPGTAVPIWLVDCPALFALPSNPYTDAQGRDWPNNAERFALFCHAAVAVAMDRAYLGWRPDIVHCHDWQSGLVPALLSLETDRPATVFTLHNLAYQGLFSKATWLNLKLPAALWHPQGLEFNGMMSFIKGGLAYADHITTVSPSYAQEIQSAPLGNGLEGLLHHRRDVLTGIINGIDAEQWDPNTDTNLSRTYNAVSLSEKQHNKTALQNRLSLPVTATTPLLVLISRLVAQKGIDLLLACLPELMRLPLQVAVLGSGDHELEQQLTELAHTHHNKLAVTIGYDEALAHLMEAGGDLFLMPSRFEPCGLNQLYSQRYGTPPIVRNTGGLADTVVDTVPETLANGTATGFVFNEATPGAFMEAIKRALWLYSQDKLWRQVQQHGMAQDYSFTTSAQAYMALYAQLAPPQ